MAVALVVAACPCSLPKRAAANPAPCAVPLRAAVVEQTAAMHAASGLRMVIRGPSLKSLLRLQRIGRVARAVDVDLGQGAGCRDAARRPGGAGQVDSRRDDL